MNSTFKQENTFNKRIELYKRFKLQHPDRVPIIVQLSTKKLFLNNTRYLSPLDISVSAFLGQIRKQSNISSEEAIYLYCGSNGGTIVPITDTIGDVYNKYKDEDGFLYMTVTLDNAFGVVHSLNYVLDNVLDSSSRLAKTLGLHIF